ncbi:putative F-box protein At4g38870 [Neltuma alba]|uniref:putative F-box protein At4g38870 n=1 Tax=Neltuma alba TaxID=207710 RepID=UPI0010A3A860|nr:putative F-box protein At4g38870 [Prosopis alba]
MEDHIPFVPCDIILNILKRLPVKSLIRFQCVCKDWKNLIKTPFFIQDHLHHSSHQNPLLLLKWLGDLRIVDRHNMQVTQIQISPLVDSCFDLVIVGSSNGLLCVQVVDNLVKTVLPWKTKENGIVPPTLLLWNPATRHFRKLPLNIKDFNSSYRQGFGFSPIDNDYKIVRIYVCGPCFAANPAQIYSLKAGSWKEVEFENLEGIKISKWENVAVNGVMYFSGRDPSTPSNDDNLVVSIDLTKEVCTLIPLPDLKYNRSKRLIVYEDKLAVVAVILHGSYIVHLWVMEEDICANRGRWIWTKKYTSSSCPRMLHPMTIWRNEIVFCTMGDDVYTLNLTTNEFKTFVVKCGSIIYDSCTHVESLVSVGNISNKES